MHILYNEERNQTTREMGGKRGIHGSNAKREKKNCNTLWEQITAGRQAVKGVRFEINVKKNVWGSATEGRTRADGVRDRALLKIFRLKRKRVTEDRQCAYNVTLRCVRVTTVTVKKS